MIYPGLHTDTLGDMTTKISVEVFEEEDSEQVTLKAQDAEAMLRLLDQLNLPRLKNLVTATPEGTHEIALYPQMTEEQQAVYGVLYPRKDDLSTYDRGMLPMRILNAIEAAKTQGFVDFKVWHDQKPDPLLTAKKGTSWNDPVYLIARWGKTLKSFKELKEEAAEKLKRSAFIKLTSALQLLETDVEKKLNGESVYNPGF